MTLQTGQSSPEDDARTPFRVEVAVPDVIRHRRWRVAREDLLEAVIERGYDPGVVALTGASGSGRSLLLADMAQALQGAGHQVELLHGRLPPGTESHTGNIVLVDDADHLPPGRLRALAEHRVPCVVAGPPGWTDYLASQSIPVIPVALLPLSRDDVAEFAAAELERCHLPPDLLQPDAIAALTQASGGIARNIRTIAGLATFLARLEESPHVTATHVERATPVAIGTDALEEAPEDALGWDPDDVARETAPVPAWNGHAPPHPEHGHAQRDHAQGDEEEDEWDPPPPPPPQPARAPPPAPARQPPRTPPAARRAPMTAPARLSNQPRPMRRIALVAVLLIACAGGAVLALQSGQDAAPASSTAEAPKPATQPSAAGTATVTPPTPLQAPAPALAQTTPQVQAQAAGQAPGKPPAAPAGDKSTPLAVTTPALPPGSQPVIPQRSANAAPLHVLISYRHGDPNGLVRAMTLASQLRAHGYDVAKPAAVPDRSKEAGIAYFFVNDLGAASALAAALGQPYTTDGKAHQEPQPKGPPPHPGTIRISVPNA